MTELLDAVEGCPREIFLPRGMISPGEAAAFYRVARDFTTEAGAVIDAGAFCGASTYALAAGVRDASQIRNKSDKVHSYDLFKCKDRYTLEFIQNNFLSHFDLQGVKRAVKLEVTPGESFRSIYDFQVCGLKEHIVVHEGSILEERWSNQQPISVLMIDVAKTLDINRHMLTEFLPNLGVGGVLIQQDFHHIWHSYIHVTMQVLAPYFEIILSQVSASRMYRLTRAIPPAELQAAAAYAFSEPEIDAHLAAMCDAAPSPEKPLLSLVLPKARQQRGDLDGMRTALAAAATRFGALAAWRSAVEAQFPKGTLDALADA